MKSSQSMRETLYQIHFDIMQRTTPNYAATNYPELLIIRPRHKRPVFTASPTLDMPSEYKCDLCDTTMQSGEELT
jgi:hypothetical protein